MTPRPTITEEPLVTIHLLNEIRNFCGQLCPGKKCDMRGTSGSINGCRKINANIGVLRQKAGAE